ncbi:hypothetical protein C5167_008283 [Papaver somniferum]|uniref:CRAL-TRIO domain-containing protein n=1 Tax=Papaver somniferum TaxID=3469 RepID=A0A4Y7JV60_PAPSO|nr:phosphatidylinositol transfer protein 3-like [Papaver somniferum]RZC64597.1 hypothetical protein C5167_008283 [Papaver somniferum]
MSTDVAQANSNGNVKLSSSSSSSSSSNEEQEKINEVRRSLGPLKGALAAYCTDASIARYLRARNWHVKKATKMLKQTLKWRSEYKPEEIRWEHIANEAATGKIYRLNQVDKYGRTVLVLRPSSENSKSTKGKIRYFVYCMENAILNLAESQEQMVWLIDFHGFNMSHISVNVTRETAIVLQNHYPERLGVAILYNPPKFFEPFWMIVKPFLEPKTQKKVKFVYSDDPNRKKIMEDLFDMDDLESSFGGNKQVCFNISEYSERMKEEEKKMPAFWSTEISPVTAQQQPTSEPTPPTDPVNVVSDSGESDKEQTKTTSAREVESIHISPENNLPDVVHECSVDGEKQGHSAEGISKIDQEIIEVK